MKLRRGSINGATVKLFKNLRYSSGWKLQLRNHSYHISLESARHNEAENHDIFLRCIKCHDAIGHNVIGIQNLVWAVTSEPIKIESGLFLLLAWYDLEIGFGVQ